jgi:hypothetical protein
MLVFLLLGDLHDQIIHGYSSQAACEVDRGALARQHVWARCVPEKTEDGFYGRSK